MPELIVILVIVLLLFGAKKIPELAKGLGSGIKSFRNAVKEDEAQETQKSIEADKPQPTQSASTDATKTAA
jgi:sec-independent protein translocase protein TatA